MVDFDKQAKQAAMRARFPFSAGVTDALREVFGAAIAPTYMQQDGDKWGRQIDESRYTVLTAGQIVLDDKRDDENKGRK